LSLILPDVTADDIFFIITALRNSNLRGRRRSQRKTTLTSQHHDNDYDKDDCDVVFLCDNNDNGTHLGNGFAELSTVILAPRVLQFTPFIA
jgi:hypothetical protein